MNKIFSLLVLVILFSCRNNSNDKPEGYVNFDFPEEENTASTNYYFIRHAEKVLEDPNDEDPQLTIQGNKRSLFWSHYFKEKKLDEFYTTSFMRNFQTIIPTMHEYQGKPTTYDADQDSLFTKEFWSDTSGKNVLVVGHNNTTPKFANEIIRKEKYPLISEKVYGNLYHVQIDKFGKVLDTLISIENFNLPEDLEAIFEAEFNF